VFFDVQGSNPNCYFDLIITAPKPVLWSTQPHVPWILEALTQVSNSTSFRLTTREYPVLNFGMHGVITSRHLCFQWRCEVKNIAKIRVPVTN